MRLTGDSILHPPGQIGGRYNTDWIAIGADNRNCMEAVSGHDVAKMSDFVVWSSCNDPLGHQVRDFQVHCKHLPWLSVSTRRTSQRFNLCSTTRSAHFALSQSGERRQRCPDSVEKVENRGVLYFRYRSKISKTAAKIARPDLQAASGSRYSKISHPFGQNFQNPLYKAEIFAGANPLPTFNRHC